jgi:macrolide transport system ATP-binding/permease protein
MPTTKLVSIHFLQDVRYGWRALWKWPGFALVGILSMGIGIGLTTVLYTSNWQRLTRQLPAAHADRLVMPEKPASYYYIEQYRAQTSVVTGVAAVQIGIPFDVVFQGDASATAQRVFGQLVSPDYFSVLGVGPQLGRVLSPELDKRGGALAVVVSDRFWRNRLNASSSAIGQTLRVNGQLATIVGVTPQKFNGVLPANPAELFVPVTAPAAIAPELANDVLEQHQARDFIAIMSLVPGVSLESAESAVDAVTRRLDAQDTSAFRRSDKGRRVTLVSAGGMVPIPRNVKPAVEGFFIALMGLIMIIACMNLANILLARAANRRKEVALRMALGASRFRVVRQMMTEGLLLALLGGVAGLALAYGIGTLRSQFTPLTPVPTEIQFTPDWHAALFVFGVAVVSCIGFSLAPALWVTKEHVTRALKEGSAMQVAGFRRFGLRNVLMVLQLSGSLMLLLLTGFLVLGLRQVSSVDLNIDPHGMYLLSVDPVRQGYAVDKAEALLEHLRTQLEADGAVRAVAYAAQAPFQAVDADERTPLTVERSRDGSAQSQISVAEETVGRGYFATLGEPMLAGREFTALDERTQRNGATVLPVVLNESAARQFAGRNHAIGARLSERKQSYEVVGVVHDTKNGMGPSQPVVYLPLMQRDLARPRADGVTILVRSAASAGTLTGIRRAIGSVDPRLRVFNARTLSDYMDRSRSAERFAVDTYGGIGVFALVLAAIGLAGVTAYAVAQRRREIGIRMALGARQEQVLFLVLREGAALVAIGTVLGLLGAFALARGLSALTNVFVASLEVGVADPRLLVGAPVLLALLTMLACYLPARRAAKIDPLEALRHS